MSIRLSLIVAAFALQCAGCGESGCRIGGTVTHGGRVVERAAIAFEPDGMLSPAALVPVRNGRYEIPADKQLVPGKYVVRISSIGDDERHKSEFPPYLTAAEIGPGRSEVNFDVPENRPK